MESQITGHTFKILLAEDDEKVAAVITAALTQAGFDVHRVGDGIDAINYIMTAKPGLVILDVTLPRLRGDEICAMVRSSASLGHTPIIIISGQGTVESKLRLFEVGADDYVTKPFSMSELLARVESVLPLVERTVERTELSDAD